MRSCVSVIKPGRGRGDRSFTSCVRGFSFITKAPEGLQVVIYTMGLTMSLPNKRLSYKLGGIQKRLENIMSFNISIKLMFDLVCFTLNTSVLEKMHSKD